MVLDIGDFLEWVLDYELELRAIHILLVLLGAVIGILIKLRFRKDLRKWFSEWMIKQHIVVEERRKPSNMIIGILLIIGSLWEVITGTLFVVVGLSFLIMTKYLSIILFLLGLYLIVHKGKRIKFIEDDERGGKDANRKEQLKRGEPGAERDAHLPGGRGPESG